MSHPLFENIFWAALTGPQARFAAGAGGARRYAPGFSPIVAFADPARPDFAALRAHCEPGEQFYGVGPPNSVPADWQVHAEAAMFRMVWDAPAPAFDAALDARPLTPRHVPQMLELTALTHPGPFGPRTIELGDYVGCFDGERLIAMAGERMHAGSLREISGVCTHPDAQGRGLARRLMETLIARQMRRGETPFLHVLGHNTGARRLYAKMGFRDDGEMIVRVLSAR